MTQKDPLIAAIKAVGQRRPVNEELADLLAYWKRRPRNPERPDESLLAEFLAVFTPHQIKVAMYNATSEKRNNYFQYLIETLIGWRDELRAGQRPSYSLGRAPPTPIEERPFFKYVSPETASAILRNKTFRYSSPLKFNDPFDVQSGLHIPFDLSNLHDKILDRIHQLAASPSEPTVDKGDVYGQIVLEARRLFPKHGFPRARWKELTKEAFGPLVNHIERFRDLYRNHWQESLPHLRIFSVSEEPENLLMWAHYAEDHTGALFELWSLPDEDNPLSIADQVTYQSAPPPLFTESEWLDQMTGLGILDAHGLYRRYACVKSDHWAYEREWRVWYPGEKSGRLYDDMPIRPREFRSVTLGCNAEPGFVQEVTALVRETFPETKIFRARKKEGIYGLEYLEA